MRVIYTTNLVFLFLLISSWARADMMNLNEYMPTRLEDATPMDYGTHDFQLSSVFEKQDSGDVLTYRPDYRYGITRDLQFETLGTIESGGNEKGSGDIQVGGLYRLNQSRDYFPEIGISPMLILPTGKKSRSVDHCLRADLTSTLQGSPNIPLTQVHLNINWSHAQNPDSHERADKMFYALGLSHHLYKFVAVVLDYYNEQESDKADQTSMVELGLHWSLGDDYFLSTGMGKGVDKKSPHLMSLLAFERQM